MKWLVLDCSYLCHRAFHTTGGLSFNDIKTGVIFGFLRDVVNLCGFHDTNNIVFCFDSKSSKRREIYMPYKQVRRDRYKEMDEDELKIWREMRKQVKLLRTTYLPEIGFKNIFVQKGYEADDLIASFCRGNIRNPAEAIIVASDHDLYQLLSPSVSMWIPNKKQFYRYADFVIEFGIEPNEWADVKAYAGCAGDGVEGINGVGEKTAIKFLRDELKPKSVVYQKIKHGRDIYERNLPLVKLPFKGTDEILVTDDEVTQARWRNVCEELGMTSLESMGFGPDARRRGVKPKNKRKGFGVK